MPAGIQIGTQVYVPVERIAPKSEVPHALLRGGVTAVNNRTLTVDLPYGIGSVNIASSAVHLDVGICLIRVGDFDTEATLLDPLAKSVLQYLRLLIPDDQLRQFSVRTKEEFLQIYEREAPGHSHFVIVGHGTSDSLLFAMGGRAKAQNFADELSERCTTPSTFINLCCETGKAGFGKKFSESDICKELIAPLGSLHGAVASQFLQTLLGYHFLEGRTLKVAFNKSREQVPGGAAFRLWRDGKFEGKKT